MKEMRWASVILLLMLSGGNLRSQTNGAEARQRPIRVDVELVLVNVSVIDPYNRFVTGLGKEHFQIFEDKKK